jgi:hypothetical protein
VICDNETECYIPGTDGVTKITANEPRERRAQKTGTDTSIESSQEIPPKSEQGTN